MKTALLNKGDRVRAVGKFTKPFLGHEGVVTGPSHRRGGGGVAVTFDDGSKGTFSLDDSLDLLGPVERKPFAPSFDGHLSDLLDDTEEMMLSRHKKYGAGNIAEFGELGLLVRLSDKLARLKNNQEDFTDESVDDTVQDIVGYALIWLMWRAGNWPGQ